MLVAKTKEQTRNKQANASIQVKVFLRVKRLLITYIAWRGSLINLHAADSGVSLYETSRALLFLLSFVIRHYAKV